MCPSDDIEKESNVHLQGKEKKHQAKNILAMIC